MSQTVGVPARPPSQEYRQMVMRLSDLLDLMAAVIAVGLVILTVAGSPSLARLLLSLAFVFFVPGRAVVTNWPALARWSEAAMAMVISLAVLGLAATVTLWAHAWHPIGLFQAEAVASIVALIVGAARRHGRLGESVGKAAR